MKETAERRSVSPSVPERVPSRRRAAVIAMTGGSLNLALLTLQGLLLIPLYLQFIGPRMLGVWFGTGEIIIWLAVVDIGLTTFMMQRMAAAIGRGDRAGTGAYFATGTLLLILAASVFGALILLVSFWLPGWMNVGGDDAVLLRQAFVVAGVAAALLFVSNGITSLAYAAQRPGVPAAIAIIATTIGAVATVLLLFRGYSLLALALGALARNTFNLLANLVHASLLARVRLRIPLRLRIEAVRDARSIAVPALLSKIGGAGALRSEALIIVLLLSPEVATMYVLTRRAAEIGSMMLERIGGAVFAGFSHLAAEGTPERVAAIHREIFGGFDAMAAVLLGLYLALNATFVGLWVGAEYSGGTVLMMLIAISVILTTRSSLGIYLHGALGFIVRSAHVSFAGAVLRVALMLILILTIGIHGLPIAGAITGFILLAVAFRYTARELADTPANMADRRIVPVRLAILGAGALAGTVQWATTWLGFFGALIVAAAIAAALAWHFDCDARSLVRKLLPGNAKRRFSGANA